jgi:uncharacterized iron-regulated protein
VVTLDGMNPNSLRILAAVMIVGAAGVAALVAVEARNAAVATGAQSCLEPAAWTMPDSGQPRGAGISAVLTEMAKKDVVLLGEQHDQEDDHRWQLQVLSALHAQRPDMVIGFEMFPRRAQPVLDSWVAGNLTVRQLLDESRWESVWKLPAELYLPLFQFARINRIPMVALNVDRQLTKSIAEKGWDAVPPAEREGVGRAAEAPPAYRDFLFEIYGDHRPPHDKDGAKVQKTDDAFGRFVESQTAWDRAMAEALARFAIPGTAGEKPLVVGIMGSGHIRFGHGVPHQLRDLGVKNVGTLLPVPFDFDCKEFRPGLADAVFALPQPAKAKPEPPRLGVRLEESAGAVRIADVTSGSLAETSGLKAGDQIVEVAGLPANRMLRVITAVRLQPAGTWLPVRVKRGDDTLELVVKFPAKQ